MGKAGRRRSVVWDCFDEHPASGGRRRVLCRFCGLDTVANPLRMARHVARSCPHADDAHRRICSEYRSSTERAGALLPAASASPPAAAAAVSNNASPPLPPAASAAADEETADEDMDAEEYDDAQAASVDAPAQQAPTTNTITAAATKADEREDWRPQQKAVVDDRRRRSQDADVAAARAYQRSGDGGSSTGDGRDHARSLPKVSPSPPAAAATPAAPTTPAAATAGGDLEPLAASDAQSVWTDLVLALVMQSAVGETPQLALLENEHFKCAVTKLRPEFRLPTTRDAREVVLPTLLEIVQNDASQFLKSAGTMASMTVQCSADVVSRNRRLFRWFGVDQNARCELLEVSSLDANAHPEDVAAHFRVYFEKILHQQQQQQQHQQPFMVHFCSDSLGVSRLARGLLKSSPSIGLPAATATTTLLGGCMMQLTLLLFRSTLETVTCVGLALEKCTEVVSLIRSSEPLLRDLRRRHPQLRLELQAPSTESFRSFVECVNQVVALEAAIRAVVESASVGTDTRLQEIVKDDNFWACLEFTKQVFAPFAHLLVLSDSGHATSGQVFACWLMLRNTVLFSPLVVESDKEKFGLEFASWLRVCGEDHALACLLFDPRVHGLGLSALGKRKARLIVADLGAKLQPNMNRTRLIEQLLKFLTRERPFDEDDSWNMMASMPRLFWLEYLAEMPELASVALAVLGYHPHLAPLEETWRGLARRHEQQTRGVQDPATALVEKERSTSRGDGDASDTLLLELERVKFHYEKESSSNLNTVSADEARIGSLRKYRECLVAASRSNDAALKTLFAESSNADEHGNLERSCSTSSRSGASNDACLALRQFRFLLQRVDEQEERLASDDAAGSLQRFDPEWLELSGESAQRVRACVEKFTLGSDDQHGVGDH